MTLFGNYGVALKMSAVFRV